MTDDTSVMPAARPFEIVALEQTASPDGSDADDWYRYELTQGTTTITGYKQGDANEVREEVTSLVSRLNERRAGKTSRVHLTRIGRKSQARAQAASRKN
ncbi:MAG: hypothetical protein OXC70_06270 [Gammaproteobacteria bacterium]|nr:hypothetical protein [Gammaproteobacteria bacterium]